MLAALATLLLPVGVVSGQTSIKLVGNTGEAQQLTPGMVNDFAQAFTTGSNAAGYALTGVTLGFAQGGTPTYELELRSSNSSNQPGDLLATLSKPASLSVGENTFSVAGAGLHLAAATTYYLVWELPNPQGQAAKLSFTNSNTEDSGAAAGWSIADNILLRQSQTTTWTSAVHSFRFSIRGYEGSPTLTPEQQAYAALKSYFAGEATLSETEAVVGSYVEALRAAAAAGSLHEYFDPGARTAWGTDASLRWVQIGQPGAGAHLPCGGERSPGLTGDDSGKFFWACTQGNRWVPVKLPQADIDYTPHNELTWTRSANGCMESAYDPLRMWGVEGGPLERGAWLHRVAADCE